LESEGNEEDSSEDVLEMLEVVGDKVETNEKRKAQTIGEKENTTKNNGKRKALSQQQKAEEQRPQKRPKQKTKN